MAYSREDFNNLLLSVCDNVYYTPPENIQLSYPCIIYYDIDINKLQADNKDFKRTVGYRCTIIDKDVDTRIPFELMDTFQYCSWENTFITDNLKHSVMTIYNL